MISQKIKDFLQEGEAAVYTEGKWKTAPVVIFLVMAPVVGMNGHILGFWMGAAMACIYLAIYWLSLVFLHYSDSEDRGLSIGMSLAELVLAGMLGINFFSLVIAEAQWGAGREADTIYTQEDKDYRASLARRDTEITGRKDYDLQIEMTRAEAAKTQALIEAEKTRQIRWQANALDQARRLSKETGRQVAIPSLMTGPSARSTPATEPTPEEKAADIPKPIRPEWTSQQILVWWQLRIKIGQAVEFLICVAGMGFLRFRSAANNRRRLGEAKPALISVAFLIMLEQILIKSEGQADVITEAVGASPSLTVNAPKEAKEAPETSLGDVVEREGASAQDDRPGPTMDADHATTMVVLDDQKDEIMVARPEPVKRKTTYICNKEFKLVPRTDGGWKLQTGVGSQDVCRLGGPEGDSIISTMDADQKNTLTELLMSKGKGSAIWSKKAAAGGRQ